MLGGRVHLTVMFNGQFSLVLVTLLHFTNQDCIPVEVLIIIRTEIREVLLHSPSLVSEPCNIWMT